MLVLPLNDEHDKRRFNCGDDELNKWFSQVARQHRECQDFCVQGG